MALASAGATSYTSHIVAWSSPSPAGALRYRCVEPLAPSEWFSKRGNGRGTGTGMAKAGLVSSRDSAAAFNTRRRSYFESCSMTLRA